MHLARAHRAPLSAGSFSGACGPAPRTPSARFLTHGLPWCRSQREEFRRRQCVREGGKFSSRMEAKDGSMGFDFAGTYTKVIQHKLIEYAFGDRTAEVDFTPGPTA